jgi:hypothetical protein
LCNYSNTPTEFCKLIKYISIVVAERNLLG